MTAYEPADMENLAAELAALRRENRRLLARATARLDEAEPGSRDAR